MKMDKLTHQHTKKNIVAVCFYMIKQQRAETEVEKLDAIMPTGKTYQLHN